MAVWTSEDRMYAAATAAAGALVLLLAVYNFGLVGRVPGILPATDPGPTGILGTTLIAEGPAVGPQPESPGVLGVVLGVGQPAPPFQTPTQPPPPADTTPPVARILTGDGSVVLTTTDDAVVGVATDDASGVDRVVVRFAPALGDAADVTASLECADATQRSCSWSASPPDVAGNYTVTAQATDRASNVGPPSDPVNVTVVTAQPLSGNDSESTGLVGGAVGVVTGTVGGLVRTVGRLLGL